MLNALLYTFILYHILFLLICDAFMCVHCIVFNSSATEALINNNNNRPTYISYLVVRTCQAYVPLNVLARLVACACVSGAL